MEIILWLSMGGMVGMVGYVVWCIITGRSL
jgi:hypothetical protein